jgi:hypothetical protein
LGGRGKGGSCAGIWAAGILWRDHSMPCTLALPWSATCLGDCTFHPPSQSLRSSAVPLPQSLTKVCLSTAPYHNKAYCIRKHSCLHHVMRHSQEREQASNARGFSRPQQYNTEPLNVASFYREGVNNSLIHMFSLLRSIELLTICHLLTWALY